MQVRALGSPCDAHAEGFSTTHVSGAVIAAATDAELEAIMTDIGIPAALRVQFRLIFAKWKWEEYPFVFSSPDFPDQVRLPYPEVAVPVRKGSKSKCDNCFGKCFVTCYLCNGTGQKERKDCQKCKGQKKTACPLCDATGFKTHHIIRQGH